MSNTWLLMIWIHALPSHLQPWYWFAGKIWPTTKAFNCLYLFNVGKLMEIQIYFIYSKIDKTKNRFMRKGLSKYAFSIKKVYITSKGSTAVPKRTKTGLHKGLIVYGYVFTSLSFIIWAFIFGVNFQQNSAIFNGGTMCIIYPHYPTCPSSSLWWLNDPTIVTTMATTE